MKNPFQKLFNKNTTTNTSKKDLEKKITRKAWEIAKKVPFGKLKNEDVVELEKLYTRYFALFPDIKGEQNSMRRIAQLRTMIK